MKLKNIIKEEIEKVVNNKKFTVYLMVGIPGAGKSTWIKNNLGNIPVVSRDIIRIELGMCNDDEKCVGSREQEQQVTVLEHERIEELAKQHEDFVIDDTNTGKFRSGLIAKLKGLGAYVIGVNVDTPLDVCIQRRQGQIPPEIMQNIFNRKVNLVDGECDEIINVN